MEIEVANLLNICDGAPCELFDHELAAVLANIADVSTPADAKRTISLEFQFMPFPDRRGMHVSVTCKGKVASVSATPGTLFISKPTANSPAQAYIEDPRQEKLFEKQPVAGSQQ